jgi:uncharacterized membrane protein
MAIDTRKRASIRARLGFWWIALTATAIAVFAPLPYVTESLRELADNGGDLAANYVERAPWIQAAFYVHIVFGGLALLMSPLQFVARLRASAPHVHRVCGRIVFASIGLAGVAGAVLSTTNLAGPIGTAGFGALAVLWVGSAITALRAIRRREVAAHRRWVIRTFALTYAAVTLRLWLGLLIGVQVGALGVNEDVAFGRAYAIVPFLCWIPNLIVAEIYLRHRSATEVPNPNDVVEFRGRTLAKTVE